jgi:hypothetical protein
MYILLTGFMILNLLFGFIDWVVVGDTNLNATVLVQPVSANTTTLQVASTAGFYVADYVVLGDEEIKYNGIDNTNFLFCSRGYHGTTAILHNSGTKVYGRISAALNASVGFNIINTGASVGNINVATEALGFVQRTLPSMVSWNFYWMKNGFWQYLRMICFAVSTGLIFVVVIQLLSALGGVLQRAFVR